MGKGNVNNFSSARFYSVVSTVKGRHEVEAVFNFNGTEIKRFYYFKDKKGLVDADYIKMAKDQYQREINNGYLAKYASSYVGRNATKVGGHAAVVIAVFSSVAAVALAGLFTWRYLTSRTDPEYHKVTFVSRGGTEIDDETIKHGEKAIEPKKDPEIPGREFQYWSDKKDASVPYDFNLPVNDNLILYAKYGELRTQYVTFDYNYYEPHQGDPTYGPTQKDPLPVAVTYGQKVARIPDPIRDGYVFDNWYTSPERDAQQLFNFDQPIVANITIYAHWKEHVKCTVTFDGDGGTFSGRATKEEKVFYGSRVSKPSPDPVREGYTFDGNYGYVDSSGEHNFNFSTEIKKDWTLYAKWTINKCTVHFHENGGSYHPADQTVNNGEKVQRPEDPTKDGFTFGGWYDNEQFEGNQFNFDEPLKLTEKTSTLNLYAKWDQAYLNVSVDPNGGKWSNGDTGAREFTKAEQVVPYGTTLGQLKEIAEDLDPTEPIVVPTDIDHYPAWAKLTSNWYEALDASKDVWTRINDNYVIKSDVRIRVNYEVLTGTIHVDDSTYDGFSTEPADLPLTASLTDPFYKTWKEVKGHFMVGDTGCRNGFHLDHYEIDDPATESHERVPLTDDFKFNLRTLTSYTIYPIFRVDVSFVNEEGAPEDYHLPYQSGQFLTGEEFVTNDWEKYKPVSDLGDSTDYDFVSFTTSDSFVIENPDENPHYTFTKPVTFTANYRLKEAGSFTEDPWKVFLSEITKPFGELTSYNEEYVSNTGTTEGFGSYAKVPNSYVGLIRKVELANGQTHFARVVNQEPANPVATDHMSFTFEFVETLTTTTAYGPNNNYSNASSINGFLANYIEPLLPTDLRSGLKSVNKAYVDVSTYDPESTDPLPEVNTKLFIPSASELGFTEYPDMYALPVANEGAAFNWYTHADIGATPTKTVWSESHVGTTVNYWTRSAEVTSTSGKNAWAVNTTGGLGIADGSGYWPASATSDYYYFAPAFVVGQ